MPATTTYRISRMRYGLARVTLRARTKPYYSGKKPSNKVRRIRTNKAVNDFQVGIEEVREAMKGQVGVRVEMSVAAFNDYWPDADERCKGVITGPSYEGKFVAECKFHGDNGMITLLTAASLMRLDTKASWRKPNIDAHRYIHNKNANDEKHMNAFKRAEDQWSTLLGLGVPLDDRVVLTLDGHGPNRIAGEQVFRSRNVPPSRRPQTWTLEKDPNVALGQRIALGFGSEVYFTGADPHAKNKAVLLRRPGQLTIEDVIMSKNNIVSEVDKRRVVWLNLDYCGGPPMSHSIVQCSTFMTAVVARLSNLEMITITIARRNHPNLDETFDEIIPPPYGFRMTKEYCENRRVLCKMYVRVDTMPRRLCVPGTWWVDADPMWRNKRFDAIVVKKEKQEGMYKVYVPLHDANVEAVDEREYDVGRSHNYREHESPRRHIYAAGL